MVLNVKIRRTEIISSHPVSLSWIYLRIFSNQELTRTAKTVVHKRGCSYSRKWPSWNKNKNLSTSAAWQATYNQSGWELTMSCVLFCQFINFNVSWLIFNQFYFPLLGFIFLYWQNAHYLYDCLLIHIVSFVFVFFFVLGFNNRSVTETSGHPRTTTLSFSGDSIFRIAVELFRQVLPSFFSH